MHLESVLIRWAQLEIRMGTELVVKVQSTSSLTRGLPAANLCLALIVMSYTAVVSRAAVGIRQWHVAPVISPRYPLLTCSRVCPMGSTI